MDRLETKHKIREILDLAAGSATGPAYNASVYTQAFAARKSPNTKYALGLKMAGTTIAIKVELEQGRKLPATEGASDANFCVPAAPAAVMASISDKNLHIEAFSPNVSPYLRFKLTGLTGCTADMSFDVLEVYITNED